MENKISLQCGTPRSTPYQNYTPFRQTATIPQMGNGTAKAYADHTDIESQLRPMHPYKGSECTGTIFRDYGTMQTLHSRWQQDDYRPLHFTTQSNISSIEQTIKKSV